MSSPKEYLGRIGLLMNEAGPKSEAYVDGGVYIEGGPMHWNDGGVRGSVFGPYKTEDDAHNYVAVKLERHRLANAAFHGEEGRPPHNDREYMGHPMFQYRIMSGAEYFSRYYAQTINIALSGMIDMVSDSEPEIFWPNKDGTEEAILDDDEWTEGEADES